MKKRNEGLTLKTSLLFAGSLLLALVANGAAEAATIVPFQKFASSQCAGNSNNCQFLAQKVPNDRRLEITSVSCQIRVAGSGVVDQLYARLSAFVFDFYVPTLMHDGGNRYFTFNTQTNFFAPAGENVIMGIVATDDVLGMQCKLSGEWTIF